MAKDHGSTVVFRRVSEKGCRCSGVFSVWFSLGGIGTVWTGGGATWLRFAFVSVGGRSTHFRLALGSNCGTDPCTDQERCAGQSPAVHAGVRVVSVQEEGCDTKRNIA